MNKYILLQVTNMMANNAHLFFFLFLNLFLLVFWQHWRYELHMLTTLLTNSLHNFDRISFRPLHRDLMTFLVYFDYFHTYLYIIFVTIIQ